MRARRVRYFIAGILEHRDRYPASGATEETLMNAYWAGFRFAWRLPRFIRRMFKAVR